MATANLMRFSTIARLLADEARRQHLIVPSFRSPPRLQGADRTVRELAEGKSIVSVRSRDRKVGDIMEDLIEGILLVNNLHNQDAARYREALRAAIVDFEQAA